MNDDPEMESAIELDETNLRRHWRSLGILAAYRATLRCLIGDYLLMWGVRLIVPHSSRRCCAALAAASDQVERDADVAQEGLEEARRIAFKAAGLP
jgi:hypothetical protein